jgi:DNA topoisomerase IA
LDYIQSGIFPSLTIFSEQSEEKSNTKRDIDEVKPEIRNLISSFQKKKNENNEKNEKDHHPKPPLYQQAKSYDNKNESNDNELEVYDRILRDL